MSKPHTTPEQEISKLDVIKEEEEEKEKLPSDKGDDEGYRTPTSEDHKIPESSSATSPPPAPKKQKKVFLHKRKLPKLELFEKKHPGGNEEIETLFQSIEDGNSRIQSEPEDLRHTSKKPRLNP